MNLWVGIGRLATAVELQYTPGGRAVARVLLAVDRVPVNGHRGTDWIRVVLWGRQAELCAEHCGRGSLVGVEGRLSSQWRERDGRKELEPEVVADHVEFLALRPVNGNGGNGGEEAKS